MRLIDADAFKNYIRGALEDVKHLYKDNGALAQKVTDSFCKDIDEQPTIEERKTGKWLETDSHEPCWYKCDQCGRLHDFLDNYCPNCGSYNGGETWTD